METQTPCGKQGNSCSAERVPLNTVQKNCASVLRVHFPSDINQNESQNSSKDMTPNSSQRSGLVSVINTQSVEYSQVALVDNSQPLLDLLASNPAPKRYSFLEANDCINIVADSVRKIISATCNDEFTRECCELLKTESSDESAESMKSALRNILEASAYSVPCSRKDNNKNRNTAKKQHGEQIPVRSTPSSTSKLTDVTSAHKDDLPYQKALSDVTEFVNEILQTPTPIVTISDSQEMGGETSLNEDMKPTISMEAFVTSTDNQINTKSLKSSQSASVHLLGEPESNKENIKLDPDPNDQPNSARDAMLRLLMLEQSQSQ